MWHIAAKREKDKIAAVLFGAFFMIVHDVLIVGSELRPWWQLEWLENSRVMNLDPVIPFQRETGYHHALVVNIGSHSSSHRWALSNPGTRS